MVEKNDNNVLTCPNCMKNSFTFKYQATYEYSYAIDSDAPGLRNSEEFLPFLFDKREQKDIKQYLECNHCGSNFPCYFDEWNNRISLHDLQNAISAYDMTQAHPS